MKKYLLIDGENFVHKVAKVLRENGVVKSRAGLRKFNIWNLFPKETNLDINYYATTIVLPHKNHSLYRKVDQIRKWNKAWVPYLISQNVNYVKAGSLKVRDGKICSNCGSSTKVLLEKGVDVRLAVDLVDSFSKGDEVFLLSSDTDLVPAIERAVKKGVKVVYVAFDRQAVKLISKKATSTIYLKKATIIRAYKEANK